MKMAAAMRRSTAKSPMRNFMIKVVFGVAEEDSAAASEFEQALQTPCYPEADGRAPDRAHNFRRGARHRKLPRECVSHVRQAERPDERTKFHRKSAVVVDFAAA
jgi:hypothetical protein